MQSSFVLKKKEKKIFFNEEMIYQLETLLVYFSI